RRAAAWPFARGPRRSGFAMGSWSWSRTRSGSSRRRFRTSVASSGGERAREVTPRRTGVELVDARGAAFQPPLCLIRRLEEPGDSVVLRAELRRLHRLRPARMHVAELRLQVPPVVGVVAPGADVVSPPGCDVEVRQR